MRGLVPAAELLLLAILYFGTVCGSAGLSLFTSLAVDGADWARARFSIQELKPLAISAREAQFRILTCTHPTNFTYETTDVRHDVEPDFSMSDSKNH